ncbi:O-methyltransferase family protein [Candidatus Phytoplasma oryzae]|uniref:O-methyltransferase family protein n=1 Tax=Candidatus Phytoplasma oryzae TaxID=203274 RepID=A0A139JQR5_9MOLU|nr:hypothetical protein [Candidatus Phytoplasma oryzae]KXT29321.1 O-methyltransferase family protein [Candidatus Phytoplasma oryzae]RAM57876.1 hypothetical protein DH96_00970 [Candidatus Phytoplasma oryzae]
MELFEDLNKKEKLLSKLKNYSFYYKIPIIKDEVLYFLRKIIFKNNFINIIEIGSAIGYSALGMLNIKNNIQTIERDYQRYQLALNFFKNYNYKIDFIWSEAFFYQPTKKYDLIFIDAAKVQYKKLFEKYSLFLNDNGMIICDNISLYNFNFKTNSRRIRRMKKKMDDFECFLKINNVFETVFYNIGDGLSVSKKLF